MHMLLKKKDQYILFSTPQIVKYMNMYLVQVCTYIKYNFLVLSVSVNHEFLFSDAGEKSIL